MPLLGWQRQVEAEVVGLKLSSWEAAGWSTEVRSPAVRVQGTLLCKEALQEAENRRGPSGRDGRWPLVVPLSSLPSQGSGSIAELRIPESALALEAKDQR